MKLSFYAAAGVMAIIGQSNVNAINLEFDHSIFAQIDALPVFFDELALA